MWASSCSWEMRFLHVNALSAVALQSLQQRLNNTTIIQPRPSLSRIFVSYSSLFHYHFDFAEAVYVLCSFSLWDVNAGKSIEMVKEAQVE
jgi:hypothetical protein